jgi:hypothetical protein
MSLLANQNGWWPLHAAVAWVYSRDVYFTLYAAEHGYTSLADGIKAYKRRTEESVAAVLNSEDDAWPSLREALERGTVRARGVPSDDEELPLTDTAALEAELPPTEVTGLIPRFYVRRVWLRQQFIEGRHWHNVKIARNDLEQYFPAIGSAAAESPRAHRRKAGEDAIREKYGPNGPPRGVSVDQSFRDVNKFLNKREVPSLSYSTFRRALDNVRTERK